MLMSGSGEGGQGHVGIGDGVGRTAFLLRLLLGVGHHDSAVSGAVKLRGSSGVPPLPPTPW